MYNNQLILPMKKFLSTKTEKKKTNDKQVKYYSDTRLNLLESVLVVSLAVGILLLPVYILFLIPMSRPMMSLTITSFILPFCMILIALSGKANQYQVFVGTAR
jgi:uncharacterized membrane protein